MSRWISSSSSLMNLQELDCILLLPSLHPTPAGARRFTLVLCSADFVREINRDVTRSDKMDL